MEVENAKGTGVWSGRHDVSHAALRMSESDLGVEMETGSGGTRGVRGVPRAPVSRGLDPNDLGFTGKAIERHPGRDPVKTLNFMEWPHPASCPNEVISQ